MVHEGQPPLDRFLSHFGTLPSGLQETGWLRRELQSLPDISSEAASLGVVVIHEPTLRRQFSWEEFQRWLESCQTGKPPVILIHGNLSAVELTACFRAGLFDAIPVESGPDEWTGLLQRAGDCVDRLIGGSLLRTENSDIHRRLQAHQEQLSAEAAAETDALIEAQTQLELANRRLGEHMAQVSLLYRFSRELSGASNWDDTLREILAHLADFVGAAGAALVLQSASGDRIAPRQTYRWQEQSWDKVLLRITREIDAGVASSLLAPGIFQVDRHRSSDREGRIAALPLEHHGVRLGMLLLLFADPLARRRHADAHLAFLQMVQVVLSEEIAAAQMLDRVRDIGTFNTRVLESVSSGIWVCDAGGKTVFVNRAARALLGLEADLARKEPEMGAAVGRGRLLERPLTGGAEIDDLPEIFLDRRLGLPGSEGREFEVLSASKGPFRGEGHLVDVQGQAIPVWVKTAPMAGRGMGEHWLLVILEDMREAQRAAAARQRAEQAEALVGMSATLAHEIRNPLMGLSAQAELLADSLPEDDERRRRIDLITDEVERIDRTINEMLQFVRPRPPKIEAVDPARLAHDCIELATPRAGPRNVALRLADSNSALIEADPAQIKQVILNLLFNAIDAASCGGTVAIMLDAEEALALPDHQHGMLRTSPGLRIRVEDDGPGFGDIDPEKFFQPFFTTKTAGTGLGLAYCRKVVEAHGGRIRAHRDGALTRLTVLLPAKTAAGRMLAGEAS